MALRYPGKPRRSSRGEKRDRDQGHGGPRPAPTQQNDLQGEGNYDAAREFDDAERKFVQSDKLQEGIRNAAPKSDAEEREMQEAEAQARQRAKEEDPALFRKRSAPQGKH